MRPVKIIKTVLIIVLLAVVAFVADYLLESPDATIPAGQTAQAVRDGNAHVSIEGFRLIDQDFKKIRMEVTASRASLVNRRFRYFRLALGNVVEMERPVVKIYDDAGGQTTITSEKATLDPAKKEVLFNGSCVVEAPDKARLTSDSVGWRYARGYLEVKGEYLLLRTGNETRGQNSLMDLGLKTQNKPPGR